jgi:nickel-dependent lactate racemase
MEPSPFLKTASYSKVEGFLEGVKDARFATVIPRGGRLRSVLVDAPFDAIKNTFVTTDLQPSRGLILGAGGAGYDDTLSMAIRGVWGATPGLRKSGSLLLVAECSEGLGSPALEMLATGRLTGDAERRRGRYVEGLEEISYLNRLKEDYDVLLLSALPEVYAKSKLGLSTARGSGEAVGRLINKTGRTARINVVGRAPECRLSSG